MKRLILLTIFSALAGCESYSAADLAGDIGCGAREGLCLDQCDEAYSASGNEERYQACTNACRANTGRACR